MSGQSGQRDQRGVAFDDKTLREATDGLHTALHMVSAYATERGLSLGQEGSTGKGYELAATRALLDTWLLREVS